MILDSGLFERPANYALLSITLCEKTTPWIAWTSASLRRSSSVPVPDTARGLAASSTTPKWACPCMNPTKPIWSCFFCCQCPNQTLADVLYVLRRFVEGGAVGTAG